jgi:predicted permease
MSTLINDIKYAFRQLRTSPGFAVVAVLSLALGIGANTAIFSLLNAVRLKSLPVENPHELRVFNWVGEGLRNFSISGGGYRLPDGRRVTDAFLYQTYCDFRGWNRDMADVFAYSRLRNLTVLTQNEATTAQGLIVSGNFFNGLGVRPLMGRVIEPEDDRQGAEPVVVISYKSWQQHFDLDPEVLGQTVALNKNVFTMVGVLPKNFLGPMAGSQYDFYTPMSAQPKLRPDFPLDSVRDWWVQIMARIRPGANDSQVNAAFNVLFKQTISENSLSESEKSFEVLMEDGSGGPLTNRKRLAQPLFMLMGIVGIVLLVACANLAGLLLARGASRQHELSVRVALGAGRWRLMRQSLTESMLISFAGAGLGLLLAVWGKEILFGLLWPSGINFDLRSDIYVLGFTLAVTLAAGFLFGLVPALRSRHADPMFSLKDRAALGIPHQRIGKILVSMQVGLSLLLLAGAGLFTRTLINLRNVDTGFRTENLLMFNLDASKAGFHGKGLVDFYERVRAKIAGLPGVQAVTNSNIPLLSGRVNSRGGVPIPGSSSDEGISILEMDVGESFMSTMSIPLLSGRDFSIADNETSNKVIIVNNTLAQRVFPNENPIGRLFNIGETDYQIIGVCRDIKYDNIKKASEPTIFYPYRQRPEEVYAVYYEIRTALPPLSLVPAVRKALAEIDENIPMADIKTQKIRLDESIAQERLFASLSTSLALLVVLLSCIGLFGLMAYNIAQRTSQFGVRIALGARPKDIALPVIREALLLAGVGIAIGVPVALGALRIVRSYLFGVGLYDPLTLVISACILLLVSVAAAWIPARRAAKIDPMEALRYE